MEKSKTLFEVSKLEWERVFLNFEISTNCEEQAEFYLERYRVFKRDTSGKIIGVEALERVAIDYESFDDGTYAFSCNIAAIKGRDFLNNGKWRIIAKTREKEYTCYVTHEVAYHFEDASRIFAYGNGKYAYNVSFSTVTEDETYLWMILNSYFMVANKTWKRRRYVQEAQTIPGKINRVYMSLAICLMKMFYQFWEHVLPKRGNRILLMSETKDYLWGNLKYIDEGLRRHGLDQKYKIDYSNRYFTEDIPYGLLIIKSLGILLKVATPQIDKIILWMQKRMNKQYLVNNELKGRDINNSGIIQNFCINTIEELYNL